MNFLFISLEGLISDIAWQVSKEGDNVRYYIKNKAERDIGDGFLEKQEAARLEVFVNSLGIPRMTFET